MQDACQRLIAGMEVAPIPAMDANDRDHCRHDTRAGIAQACLAGALGGLLGGLVMNTYTRVVASSTGGHEAEGVAPGDDRVGRGMQPLQAETRTEDDAAVRVGTAVYEAVTGETAGPERRLRLGALAHYGFSAVSGIAYALLVRQVPALGRGLGTLYGTLVWATADETAMPLLWLSRGPGEQSPGMHAYSLVGHWLYGATLASVHALAHRR